MPRSKDDSRRFYPTEEATRQGAISALGDSFTIYEQISASSAEGDAFRLDAVCVCAKTGYWFGLEFKRSHLFKQEFAAALRQAIHYRVARITDPRLPGYIGLQPNAVAVFPDWTGEHDTPDNTYDREADGMRLLASHFQVGAFRWNQKMKRMRFVMGESAIWHSDTGWSANAAGVMVGKRSLGARKRMDRSSSG